MAQIALFVGGIRPLPNSGRPTGIYKSPVTATIDLGTEGFAGDQQADRKVHGGPEKAVHLYPARHYQKLADRFPEAAEQLIAGSIGENISTPDLDEHDVRIGDIWRLGSAQLQVCQPRNPCWKIDARYACEGMAAYIAEHLLTGWYWRVLRGGTVAPGDPLEPVNLASTAPTLHAAMLLWKEHRPPLVQLENLTQTPGISSGWRDKIMQRVAWLKQTSGAQ